MARAIHIDAHQHFWQISRGDYHWMDDSVSAIRHDTMPHDLAPLIKRHDIEGTVVVQAAATVAETRFILELAEHTEFIKGVVGWVDLESPEAPSTLDRLMTNPFFKGVRPMLQDIADTNWILRPAVLENLKEVSKRGLRLDALITPRHLNAIAELADHVPELNIVVDHCAKPEIADRSEPGQEWRDGITKLANKPNIMCKISGLANEAGPDWSAEKLRPTTDHIIEVFGAGRIMWGSDWPVLNLVGDYSRWRNVTAELLARLSDEERTAIYGGNAVKFYGLDVKTDR